MLFLRIKEARRALHHDLVDKSYRHSAYEAFKINDPKPRGIHNKASVRDRLLHHAIHRMLYPLFDRVFIADSFSCRLGKGSHRAMDRFKAFASKVTRNDTRQAWVLKCDIRKFFASIDQAVLHGILAKYIPDKDTLSLLSGIVSSFSSIGKDVGLPLGNLTSQLLVNIYMNEFDQFAKHGLKAKYYIRYADDFIVLSGDKAYLEKILPLIQEFLAGCLKLSLHPEKVSISSLTSGVDFLGWIHFPDHRILRTSTKKRMFRNIQMKGGKETTVQSYLGLLGHGNARKLQEKVKRALNPSLS